MDEPYDIFEGMVEIKQRDPNDPNQWITKGFPLFDAIPAEVQFGLTGLQLGLTPIGYTGLQEGETGPSEGETGYQVVFTGMQIDPLAYSWDFGDGEHSSDAEPSHTFNTYGYHKVLSLICDTGAHWGYVCGVSTQVILGKMGIAGSPRSGDKPLTVIFTDESLAPTGSQFTGMQVIYGDVLGATGMISTPHTYTDYGTYNVEVKGQFDSI